MSFSMATPNEVRIFQPLDKIVIEFGCSFIVETEIKSSLNPTRFVLVMQCYILIGPNMTDLVVSIFTYLGLIELQMLKISFCEINLGIFK